jgi:hypothetical protein
MVKKCCKNCKFSDGNGLSFDFCHRYPKREVIENANTVYCGEWKPREKGDR